MGIIRSAAHRMVKEFRVGVEKRGIEGMAMALSTPEHTVDPRQLRNQLLGVERHNLSVDRLEEMVDLCDSDDVAKAAAWQRGGIFLRLPIPGEQGRDELLAKFNELYADLGTLSSTFRAAVADDEVDDGEQRQLREAAQQIHSKLEELLALTFSVYSRK